MKIRSVQNCQRFKSGFLWREGMGIRTKEKHLLFTYNFVLFEFS